MKGNFALQATMGGAPPCPLGLDMPGPLREWILRRVLDEATATGALQPRVVAVHAGQLIEARLPLLPPLPAKELAGAWGSIAGRPGVLRTFRLGMLEVPIEGVTRRCACALERLANGRYWFAWWPIPASPPPAGTITIEDHEGPGTEPHPFDELVRGWTDGFEDVAAGLSLMLPPKPLPISGSAVVLETMPLLAPAPKSLDALAQWFDFGVIRSRPILQQAMLQPPAVATLRGKMFERWIVRRPQPASLDDIVRTFCGMGDQEPDAVFVLVPASVMYQGTQVQSIHCAIESRGRRLLRQLPMVPARDPASSIWIDRVEQRVRGDDAWIGVKPSVDLDLRPDGWPFASGAGEA